MSLSKNKPNRPYQHGAVLSKSRQARVRAPKSERTREGCRTQRVIRRKRDRGAGEVCLIVGREFAKGEQDDASRGVAAASGQTVLEVATKRSSGQTSTTSWEFFV